jgi:molybdopterin synthase sulfur carrier subunit
MITARLTGGLRKLTGGKEEILLEAGDVKECIDKLEQDYPGIRLKFCDENDLLLDSINIYMNGDNIRDLQGLETTLREGDEVDFMSGFAAG